MVIPGMEAAYAAVMQHRAVCGAENPLLPGCLCQCAPLCGNPEADHVTHQDSKHRWYDPSAKCWMEWTA